MLTPDQEKLKEAALAATAGPWVHRFDPGNPAGVQHGVRLPGEFGAWVCDCLDNADKKANARLAGERNAAFIAAANPAAILAILAQLEQVQGWVSVKDRLPPNYHEVMVWPHPTDYIMTAEVWGHSASGVPVWKYGEYQTGWGHETIEMTSPPTHWREIPPPPEAA